MKRLIRMGLVALPLAWSGIALAQAATDIANDAAKPKAEDSAQPKSEGAVKDQAAPAEHSDDGYAQPKSNTQGLPGDSDKTMDQKTLDQKALDPKALDKAEQMQMQNQNPKDVAP